MNKEAIRDILQTIPSHIGGNIPELKEDLITKILNIASLIETLHTNNERLEQNNKLMAEENNQLKDYIISLESKYDDLRSESKLLKSNLKDLLGEVDEYILELEQLKRDNAKG